MKLKYFTLLFFAIHFFCSAQDLISEGSNRWIFHTPDDGRTTMWIAPFTSNDWQWGKATQFLNNGNVIFSGSIGIGTSNPTGLLGLFKSTPTNENDVIASFMRGADATGGSSVVRFGYHNTGDFEINSGYTSAGHRFGSYFDLNIVNNHLGGDHGGVNLVTNNSVQLAVRPNGFVGLGTTNPISKLSVLGSITMTSGLSNVSLRPLITSGTLVHGEFRGYSGAGNLADDGFLRFSSGGGTNGSTKSFVDLSGYSTIPEMDRNIVLGTSGNERMRVTNNGNVGIGTSNPTSKLTVAGNINSREVKVSVDAGADFVFDKDYILPSLQEVEKFVAKNKHLPEIASAKEMQKEGINLSEMNIKLLQKIEELTLYVIELKKENESQNKKIEQIVKTKK